MFSVCVCVYCICLVLLFFFFFFQAEDGIRDIGVTGVQTCALPIFVKNFNVSTHFAKNNVREIKTVRKLMYHLINADKIGRASCRERV